MRRQPVFTRDDLRKRPKTTALSTVEQGAIFRAARHSTAVGDLIAGTYLLVVAGCMLANDLSLQRGAGVLSAVGMVRFATAMACGAYGGFLFKSQVKASHQHYLAQWLHDNTSVTQRTVPALEVSKEQQAYRNTAAGVFAGAMLANLSLSGVTHMGWQEQLCQLALAAVLSYTAVSHMTKLHPEYAVSKVKLA